MNAYRSSISAVPGSKSLSNSVLYCPNSKIDIKIKENKDYKSPTWTGKALRPYNLAVRPTGSIINGARGKRTKTVDRVLVLDREC